MKVLVLGATSAIAQGAARVWAARGVTLHLVARHEARLLAVADDLRTRGATVEVTVQDLNDASKHEALAATDPDVVLVAQGIQGDPKTVDYQPDAAELVLRTNFVAPVQFLTLIAPRMRPGTTIAVISSVAGDRGRNKPGGVYSASKAALSGYLSALRQRLGKAGVRVITIKPGFVDTPMTANHLPKNALFASPDVIGRGIVRAVDRGAAVVYLPWFWRFILVIVRAIPESLFKRLSF
ncbi:MAG TPA: SDR family NAD(P)-dependent oxidoreductase [Myxococcales bacterium]|nr:SDR family NAD(P)-dependent oxidoreductase [Myxococcales bacterium]